MSEERKTRESRLFVGSLERGLHILTAFDHARSSMKLAELAQVTGLSRSAVQRFAFTLVAIGYLKKNEVTKEYSLAPKSLDIGLRYLQTSTLINISNPYVHALNRACEETCTVAEPDGLDMVYVSRFPAHKEMLINMPLGMRIPMFCNASGRAILSRLPAKTAMDMLERSERVKYTTNTLTDLDLLRDRVQEARETGFAWADSEYYSGDINIAAPILDPLGRPIGAVNISAAASRFSVEQARKELGIQVVETARAISGSQTAQQAQTLYKFREQQESAGHKKGVATS